MTPADGSQTLPPQPTLPEKEWKGTEEVLRELEERYGATVKEYGQADTAAYLGNISGAAEGNSFAGKAGVWGKSKGERYCVDNGRTFSGFGIGMTRVERRHET